MRYDFIIDDDDYVNVWIDGSCLGKGQPGARAGYGVFYNYNHFMNVSAPVKGRATNNAGEIQAATRAIRDCDNHNVDNLLIITDSHFLMKSVNVYMDRWERNNFCKANGDPLANRRDFINLYNALNSTNMHVVFEWVPAHSGDEYNDAADYLARMGARRSQPRY